MAARLGGAVRSPGRISQSGWEMSRRLPPGGKAWQCGHALWRGRRPAASKINDRERESDKDES